MIPTLFIAGAPRCGTSSLWACLGAHPRIFMSKPKEPHHFGADLEIRSRPFAERQAYLKLFEAAGDVRHAGEASVLYMYSRSAPAEILELSPPPRSSSSCATPSYAHAVAVAGGVRASLLRKAALGTVVGLFYAPLRVNLGAARPPRLSRELRCALREQLQDDVARLSALLARDLSAWLNPDA